MPKSSNFFTREASVYLAGGRENFCVANTSTQFTISPSFTLGKILCPSFSEERLYTFRKPSNFMTSPVDKKC